MRGPHLEYSYCVEAVKQVASYTVCMFPSSRFLGNLLVSSAWLGCILTHNYVHDMHIAKLINMIEWNTNASYHGKTNGLFRRLTPCATILIPPYSNHISEITNPTLSFNVIPLWLSTPLVWETLIELNQLNLYVVGFANRAIALIYQWHIL